MKKLGVEKFRLKKRETKKLTERTVNEKAYTKAYKADVGLAAKKGRNELRGKK